MNDSRPRRFHPATMVSVAAILVVLGSTASAAVLPLRSDKPETVRTEPLPASQLTALSSRPKYVRRETPQLRSHLQNEKRHDRWVTEQNHKKWVAEQKRKKAAAAAAAAAARQASAPTTPSTSSASSTPSYSGAYHADWYAIAACESGGNWAINTGNGYWGGLQFAHGTWFAYGGGPFSGSGPFPYSAAQQIAVAERVLAAQGPGAWPNCYRSA